MPDPMGAISYGEQQIVKLLENFTTNVTSDVKELRKTFEDFRLHDFASSQLTAEKMQGRMEALEKEITNVKEEIKRRSSGAERWVLCVIALSGPTLAMIFRLVDIYTKAR